MDVEAAFTFADDPADANGLTYNFTDVSDQANTFDWDFAGLDTSTDQNPTFTFPGSGDYEVCLTVDGDCGMDEVARIVTVTFDTDADLRRDSAGGRLQHHLDRRGPGGQ